MTADNRWVMKGQQQVRTQLVRLVTGEVKGVCRRAGVVRGAVEERVNGVHVCVPVVDGRGDLIGAGLVRARRSLTSGEEARRRGGCRGQGEGEGDEELHGEYLGCLCRVDKWT